MAAPKRLFTPDEVDERIPQMETVFEHISTCKSRAETIVSQAMIQKPSTKPVDVAQAQLAQSQIEFLMGAIQDDINYILSLGGVTKDIDQGLVDFPGEMDGQEVWLCWKIGEAHVQFWHGLDEGFDHRQALSRNDKNPTYH